MSSIIIMIAASLSSNMYNKTVWRDCLAFGESRQISSNIAPSGVRHFCFVIPFVVFHMFSRGKSTCAESFSRHESPRAEGCKHINDQVPHS